MHVLSTAALTLARILLAGAFVVILVVPAWWLAGRFQDGKCHPFFRLLTAIGLALVGYLSIVNLVGRATGNSLVAVGISVAANAAATVAVWNRWRAELDVKPLLACWRTWMGPLAVAIMLGLPQWLVAVSTNFWDEAVPSGIYLTAPNQFAEGLFPPRHNAFPDVPLKYHYGFTILSGTVTWLGGVSPNVATDLVSTGLWLFVFLFIYFWLRDLEFDVVPSLWGSFATVLGGGLAWLYVGRIEAYSTGGYFKLPAASDLVQRYDPALTWFANVLATATTPSQHLRNADGTLSNLPWNIAAELQQHAVTLGIALTPVALCLLVNWQKRTTRHVPLLVANIVTFSVLPLGHAVFGAVAAASAGVCVLWSWLQERTRGTFFRGLWFGVGMLVLMPLHGGMFATGAAYGPATDFATIRKAFGYAAGGLSGFVHWNLAGFGLPLVLALFAAVQHGWRRDARTRERNLLFTGLAVLTAASYLVPQVMFYSSASSGVEQFTEVSKFFFCAHFGFALLSVFGVARLSRRLQAPVVAVCGVMAAITPVAFCWANSVDANGAWRGFYRSPYEVVGGKSSVEVEMGVALRRLKQSNRDVYYDASGDELTLGYLSGLLIYGGSLFTLTPSQFERNGVGFRLSEDVVARRIAESGRMARLAPGAPEESGATWYYARPGDDLALTPVIVRSRFEKLVREGYFVPRHQVGARVLYSIDKSTRDLDVGIERYWQPRIVAQARTHWNKDGKADVMYFDPLGKTVRVGDESMALATDTPAELGPFVVAPAAGTRRADLLFGRLGDAVYRTGHRIEDIQEYKPFFWSSRDGGTGQWQPEHMQWLWDWDTPLVADLHHDGIAQLIVYRHRTGEWLDASGQTLAGPAARESDLPLPFAGRFLSGSASDLGLWSLKTGIVTLRSLSSGQTASFGMGGGPDDMLVPGDYEGTGSEQVAVWRRRTSTWQWRRAADGRVSEAVFGTPTGIPVPWDYNHDGRVDLAYWEPVEGKIFVSFNRGRTVDLILPVPPHTIPAFVNMY